MDALIKAASKYSDEMLREALFEIGGESGIDTDKAMVRAAMIQVIGNRHGDDAADAIMDELGM